MKKTTKVVISFISIAVLSVILAFAYFNNEKGEKFGVAGDSAAEKSEQAKDSRKIRRSLLKSGKSSNGRANRVARGGVSDSTSEDSSEYENLTEDEAAKLTPEQCRILDAIRKAHDDEDKNALVKIVQKLQMMEGWPDSVPVIIRQEAIEALAWHGSSCLAESVLFLADTNEEVLSTAVEQFEDAVEDSDLGDIERGKIMIMASEVIKDSDAMDSMLFELNNMRNSVAVETIKALWERGNAVTQSLLADAVESFTGEDGIDTPAKLDAWLKENPDDSE